MYFLNSDSVLVRARASGAIHNISADSSSIRPLREAGCIVSVIRLLRDCSIEICLAATGTLQNMSREARSREIILEEEGILPLTDLLFGNDMQCQVSLDFFIV